ncbi:MULTISPECIES: hypothetical protein [Pseudomonas]|uniref:hypothetical protein n=1 Tax=Pseudomonas TaxID=286 RepID=UPI001AE8786F|nr:MULTISPECIES: hypothetical protein [unclassified Pseudomonas]MBP1086057.1 carbamoylphosphate synthase small subunit [Pseudomonas sp. PvP007]MBP1192908.1 carbamoylphosphate synthase small subunit [Pseudomonas sp. PvP100]
MSNQAQIDALEHLLMAVLKSSPMTMNSFKAFENAQSSLLGSNGPGGPNEKSAAVDYLSHLKSQL